MSIVFDFIRDSVRRRRGGETGRITDPEAIADWCRTMGIKNFTVNEDATVDVFGDVLLANKSLSRIPVKFHNVHGAFVVCDNPLESMQGAPYRCSEFRCTYNKRLRSMEGGPLFVDGSYSVNHCTRITSFVGGPKHVGHIMSLIECGIDRKIALRGAPVVYNRCLVSSIHSYLHYRRNIMELRHTLRVYKEALEAIPLDLRIAEDRYVTYARIAKMYPSLKQLLFGDDDAYLQTDTSAHESITHFL